MAKLAVFDFDSTLMDGETIDFLAAPLGLEAQVAAITERAMAGELDFFKSLVARVALLEGLEKAKVDAICADLPMMTGAAETVAGLKQKGCTVVCFSGGFRNATKPACERLGIDADFSNFLHDENGNRSYSAGKSLLYFIIQDLNKGLINLILACRFIRGITLLGRQCIVIEFLAHIFS